jgi:hypothetical protein
MRPAARTSANSGKIVIKDHDEETRRAVALASTSAVNPDDMDGDGETRRARPRRARVRNEL